MELPDKTHPLADHWMRGEGAYQLKLEKTQFKTSECTCAGLGMLQGQTALKKCCLVSCRGLMFTPLLG